MPAMFFRLPEACARRTLRTMTIRDYLESRKMSQADFAARLGVDRSTVARWAGRSHPPVSRWEAIEKATGGAVSLSDLLRQARGK